MKAALVRIGGVVSFAVLVWIAVNTSTRLLGVALLLTAMVVSLIAWRHRRIVAVSGFALLAIAEVLPFDVTLLHTAGPPRLVPYRDGVREGRPVIVGRDGQFHFVDHPSAICVSMPLFLNPPRYVVVW